MSTLIGKKIYVQNASLSYPADVWSSCGLPTNYDHVENGVQAQEASGARWPVVLEGQELFTRVPLAAGEKKELTIVATSDELETPGPHTGSVGCDRKMALSTWATDEIQNLMPLFYAYWEGSVEVAPTPTIRRQWINGARLRVEFQTVFPNSSIKVKGWFDFFDQQEIIEWKIIVSYGSTDFEDEWATDGIGSVHMLLGEKIWLDHRINKGLPDSTWDGNNWDQILVDTDTWSQDTGIWHKAHACRLTGAIRTAPPVATWGAWLLSDPRYLNTLHREEASVQCMLDKEEWKGNYGAFGEIPVISQPGPRAEALADFYTDVHSRLSTPSDENVAAGLAYGGLNYHGAAGKQPDFGAAGATYCIGYNEPAALHWYQRDLDFWFRRQYWFFNKSDGEWISHEDHPGTETFGLQPHPAHSSDTLGLLFDIPNTDASVFWDADNDWVYYPNHGLQDSHRLLNYVQLNGVRPSTLPLNYQWGNGTGYDVYYIIRIDRNRFRLCDSVAEAQAGTYHTWTDSVTGTSSMRFFGQRNGTWGVSDNQHRTQNLLCGMFQLTRDPSIADCIRNTLQLEARAHWRDWSPSLGTGIGDPRGWGRPLITLCHAYKCGFTEAEPLIRRMMEIMWQSAHWRNPALPANVDIQVASREQTQFGYFHTVTNQLIYGVSPWQESILAMGLYAAWLLFPDLEEARTMILTHGRTIVNHVTYQANGTGPYHNSYVYAWNHGAGNGTSPPGYGTEGSAWPLSWLSSGQTNYTDPNNGFHIWMRPWLQIMNILEPSARLTAILAQNGPFESYDHQSAQWWAVDELPELT